MDSMKDIFEKNNLLKPPKVGEILEGRIIGKGRSSVFFNLGPLGTGIIYGKELQESKDSLKDLKIGDSIFVKIVDLENEEGYIELSLKQAGQELTWEALKEKKEKNETLKVKILGANKGGLLTEILGIPAFLPVSQLSPEHYPRVEGGDSLKILRGLQKFIGKELEVKILNLSQKEGKFISSGARNKFLSSEAKRVLILSEKAKEIEKIKESLKGYKVGDVVEGEISGLVDFGAFMFFGKGLEGLIHISEFDWAIVQDPSEIVKVGQKIRAKIIEISDNKVFLSLKSLKRDPWKNIEKKYKKGDKVSGKVTKFNPFGAFVQITPKIQGLVHISEFGTKSKMEEILEIDKKYDFQILSIDPKEHRMSLKLFSNEMRK